MKSAVVSSAEFDHFCPLLSHTKPVVEGEGESSCESTVQPSGVTSSMIDTLGGSASCHHPAQQGHSSKDQPESFVTLAQHHYSPSTRVELSPDADRQTNNWTEPRGDLQCLQTEHWSTTNADVEGHTATATTIGMASDDAASIINSNGHLNRSVSALPNTTGSTMTPNGIQVGDVLRHRAQHGHFKGGLSVDNENVPPVMDVIRESSQVKSFSSLPGPWPSLPLIGTGWQYFPLVGRYDLSKLHEAHLDRYRRYGPIFKEEYQWGKAIVHIYHPDDFETLSKSTGRCPIRPPNEFVSLMRASQPDRYPNVGLVNLNGEEWLEQRHRLAPAIMKLKTIHENMTNQNEICDDFLNYLYFVRDPKTGIVENIQDAVYRLSLESNCMMCLDSRIGAFDSVHSATSKNDGQLLIESTQMLFDIYNKLYYGLPLWKLFKTSTFCDLEHASDIIYQVASKYVQKAMDNFLNDETDTSRHTVLQTMLNTKGLSHSEVKTTLIEFISGGIFTISNTLTFLLYNMAANPEVQDKLYKEIDYVLSNFCTLDGPDNEVFRPEHFARMPYLKACVRESLRLSCPVPGIMRVTSKPIVLSGYYIPEQTPILVHTMATCLLPEYFKDPNKFWPERWIDPIEQSSIHPFALLPFGFGNRMCIGKRFSETELYLTLAKTIRTFRLGLVQGKEELDLKHAFIVVPAHPISLRLTPRCD